MFDILTALAVTIHLITIVVIWKSTYALMRLNAQNGQKTSVQTLLFANGMSFLLFSNNTAMSLTYPQELYILGTVQCSRIFACAVLIQLDRIILIIDLGQTIMSNIIVNVSEHSS